MTDPSNAAPVSVSDLRAGSSVRAIARPRRPWLTRVLLPTGLLAGFAVLLIHSAGGAVGEAKEVRVVPVMLLEGPAEASSVPGASTGDRVVAQATGWLEPAPYPIIVNALADGIVHEVLVLEGDRVSKDQPIAKLIDDDAKLALRRAEAQVKLAEARRDSAKASWDNPTEHTRAVASTESLLAEAEAELIKLDSDVAAESARVEELKAIYTQIESSRRANAASETEYVTSRQRLAAQTAVLAATEAQRKVLAAQVQTRRAELAAARERATLRITDRENVAAAEATLAEATAARDEAALRLTRMTVTAPADAVVMSRHVDVGSKLMLGGDDPRSATVVRLYDPKHLQVRVDVPLADAAKVGVGMEAEITVSVLPDQTFVGRVTRVVNEADVTRNTLQVKVEIDNPDPRLKPEMLARVKFLQPTVRSSAQPSGAAVGGTVLAIPESLVPAESGTVWTYDPGAGVVHRRPITLGTLRRDGWVEVRTGLVPGDRIVVEPLDLTDGQRVRVVGESLAMNKKGGRDGVH